MSAGRLVDPLHRVAERTDTAAGALSPQEVRAFMRELARFGVPATVEGVIPILDALPIPDQRWYRRIVAVRAIATVAEVAYVCLLNQNDAYAWMRLSGEAQYLTLRFWLNDVPATATTACSYLYANTTTAVNLGNGDPRFSRGGEVVGSIITSDSARTAGTATVQPRINGVATAFDGGSCALDATLTVADSSHVAPGSGLVFTGPANIGAAVVTSGWGPITANVVVELVLRLDPW